MSTNQDPDSPAPVQPSGSSPGKGPASVGKTILVTLAIVAGIVVLVLLGFGAHFLYEVSQIKG